MARRRQPACNLPDCVNWTGKKCKVDAETRMEAGTIGERQKEQQRCEQYQCRER